MASHNIIDYFISSPWSGLVSIIMAISLTCLFDFIGRRIWKSEEVFARALYFFAGQLVFTWVILLISCLGFAHQLIFQIINSSIVLWFFSFYLSQCRIRNSIEKLIQFYHYQVSNTYKKLCFWLFITALIAWSIISISPPTDADSLDYHLGVPLNILNNHSIIFDSGHLHFRMFGFSEMLNVFGLANGCPQWSAAIQWIGFLWLLRLISESHNGFNKITICLIFLGLPVLLSLLPSQKNLMNGIACTSICFLSLVIYSNKLNKSLLTVWILASSFALGLKYSFLISGCLLFILLMYKNRTSLRFIHFVLLLISLCPLIIVKYVRFNDPISPLLSFLSPHPNELAIRFTYFLKHYADSGFSFPICLFLPQSFGSLSTILGLNLVGFLLIYFLFKNYKAESIIIISLCFLIILGGQKTSRFFLEPLFWLLPLAFVELKNHPKKRIIFNYFSFQFYLMLPLVLVASVDLGWGLSSNAARENLMQKSSSYYEESKWVNEFLPKSAHIATDIRSRSFLKIESLPFEYIFFYQAKDSTKMSQLLKEKYKTDFLVLSDEVNNLDFKKQFAGKLIAGPKKFKTATRNPFNKKEYQVSVYALKKN